jgi:hypothetical protein
LYNRQKKKRSKEINPQGDTRFNVEIKTPLPTREGRKTHGRQQQIKDFTLLGVQLNTNGGGGLQEAERIQSPMKKQNLTGIYMTRTVESISNHSHNMFSDHHSTLFFYVRTPNHSYMSNLCAAHSTN